MSLQPDLRYNESHEWVRAEDDGTVTVGITDFAQEQLGDVVFVETPEMDRVCEAGEAIAVVESVKAASDLYAPLAGQIIAVNDELGDSPELINDDPYQKGWIFRMKIDDASAVESLLSMDDYQAVLDDA